MSGVSSGPAGVSGRGRPGAAGRAARSIVVALALLASGPAARAGPVDCFADDVAAFGAAFTPPESGLRVPELPGIVLGPPGDSFPTTGSVSTVSLGRGGWILLEFTDNVIVDGPGPDFIVFENGFFRTFVPSDPNQAYSVFAEPGSVAVSADGVTFLEFPYDPSALSFVGQDATPSSALPLLRGLAGITPTFTGNYTVADDPDVWDAAGPGGVSGAGGDAFDLADVGLPGARWVLITDLGLPTGFAGPAEGFDLDAVVTLHSAPAPVPPPGSDMDGDGLTDYDETIWHQTDPADGDTDGDGEGDGVEAARCRSPLAAGAGPSFVPALDLLVMPGPLSGASHVRWNFISSSAAYDVVRGVLPGAGVPLPGAALCLEEDSFNLTTADHADSDPPPPGGAFFYLARLRGQAAYGMSASGAPRLFPGGGCAP